MLLKFDHIAVRIVNEELQYMIGAPTLDFRRQTVPSRHRGHVLDVVDLKAEVAEQAAGRLGLLFVEELEEGAVAAGKEYAVDLARRVAELVRHLAADEFPVKGYRSRQVRRAEAGVREPH